MNTKEDLRKHILEHVVTFAVDGKRIVFSGKSTPREAPWLFDFRAITLTADSLDAIAELFWEDFSDKQPFQVGALESAGIALVAAIVMKSKERGTPINGFFIRKSRKREGLMKQIEGTLTKEPVVLVDDLINTGSSFKKMLSVLEESGLPIMSLFTIVRFRPLEVYAPLGVPLTSLFTLQDFGLSLHADYPPNIRDQFDTVWKFKASNPAYEYVIQKSAPAVDGKRVYFGTDAGTFYALDKDNGSVVWSFDVGAHPEGKGIFSSPALHKGAVYFGAYDGNVYALEAPTGRKIWANSDADWVGSSPALAPDLGLLFIGLEFGLFRKRGGCEAIDIHTGKRVWSDRTPSLTHGSPLYIKEEGLVVIGSNDGVLYAYDARTGTRKWTFATSGEIKTTAAYDATRRLVVAVSHDGNVYALDAQTGTRSWTFTTSGVFYSIPFVYGDCVYVSSLDKNIYSLDVSTGKKRASFSTSGRIFASPIIAENSVWIGSNDGRLYELEPITLSLRSTQQLSERIVNKIAYDASARHFFVGTVANEMYCLKRSENSDKIPPEEPGHVE